jgi:hypothetical protein
LSETLALFGTDEPNAEQIDLFTINTEILIGVLGAVVSGIDQPKH